MKEWEGYPPDGRSLKGDDRFFLVLFDEDGKLVDSTPFERGTTVYSLIVPMDWPTIIQRRVFLAIRKRRDNVWVSIAAYELDNLPPGTKMRFRWNDVANQVNKWRETVAVHPAYQ